MSREADLYKDKIEVSLDGRQIFYLFFGGAVIVGLVFVLGVMVGRRVEARGHVDRARTTAAVDPLAALDRLEDKSLSFKGSLMGTPAATSDVEQAIGALAQARKPADKVAAPDKVSDKPADKLAAADKPSDKPLGKSADKPSDNLADKPVTKPGDVVADKSSDKLVADKLAGKSSDKPSDKSSDKPSDKSADKLVTDKLAAKSSDKPSDKSSDKPSDKSSDKLVTDKLAGKSSDKPSDKLVADKPSDKPVTKPSDKPADKPADKPVVADKPADKPKSDAKYTLQLSSFQDRAEADAFLASLKAQGYQPHVTEATVTGKTFYRVRMGTYRSIEAANDAKAELEKTAKKSSSVMKL